jgi:twinkle protein
VAEVIRDTMDFAAYMAQTEPEQKVRPARAWVDEIIDDLGKPSAIRRAVLPWQKAHDLFQFRPGEVTLWAGVNGHGKSLMTGQAIMSLMTQGERCCIASFEMKPRKTLERMSRQFSGQSPHGEWMRDPDVLATYREVYDQFGIFTDKRLWLYDQQGSVKRDTLLGVIRYCANELRIGHFVIDSLMKCVSGEDDYNAQKNFVDDLCSAARDMNIHIHLVHHIRKLSSEAQMPDKTDVKGSGSITDQVDNVLMVWRNKAKEDNRGAGKLVSETEPDAALICSKQRNGEWEGRLTLWYESQSQQFVGSNGAPALDFGSFPHHG